MSDGTNYQGAIMGELRKALDPVFLRLEQTEAERDSYLAQGKKLQTKLTQLKSESGFGTKLAEDRATIHDQAAEIERLKDALDDILNYWNQDRNDKAMFNALDTMERIADEALKGKSDG